MDGCIGVFEVVKFHTKRHRAKHFQEANRQLYYQMKNDPVFKAQIEAKYPGTFEKVSPGKRGAYPRTAAASPAPPRSLKISSPFGEMPLNLAPPLHKQPAPCAPSCCVMRPAA
jgi:hypothetical protein